MGTFFESSYRELVDSPNGLNPWWHSYQLPDGNRINGANIDKDLQFKVWEAFGIPNEGGLAGKSTLDIGAADGFYTLAALHAGASRATAIGSSDWATWPANIQYISKIWNVQPEIVTGDFRTYPFDRKFDVIFFLGVLYHLENVFDCMVRLSDLLEQGGVIYLETQMSIVESPLPLFEYASDIFPTAAIQDKSSLGQVGISNYLFPNHAAMINLAHSYDFDLLDLSGPGNRYTADHPTRRLYRLTKKSG
ncbi:MAG: class I SAM-dependent methyltransferase [Isosphaeraceae bacterium]|nr:class I SAM-dependent methyltransferase [Isosphaeraceae bacterium]